MHACMHACMYVFMYILYVCMHVCMYEGGGGMYSCPTTTNRDGTFQKMLGNYLSFVSIFP